VMFRHSRAAAPCDSSVVAPAVIDIEDGYIA
jgi:hypothetical protein